MHFAVSSQDGNHRSGYIGAQELLSRLPKADGPLADRGCDADWLREALKDKGIEPCIPGRKSRGEPIKHDKRRYKRRNRIEIMFGRLKDRRRVATRCDRCPKVFLFRQRALRNRLVSDLRAMRSKEVTWFRMPHRKTENDR
ncbi:MAG: hypothetical protein HoeaKO_33000 [Hoeflea alexandrii]